MQGEATSPQESFTPSKRYFVLVFVLCSIMLIIFTAIVYRQSKINDEHNDAILKSYDVLRAARRVLNYAVSMETGQRGYLLTGIEPYLAPYNNAVPTLDKSINELKEMVADNEEQSERVEKLRVSAQQLKSLLRGQILAYQTQGVSGITVGKLNQSKARMDAIRQGIQQIIDEEDIILKERERAARRQNHTYFLTLFLGATLAVGGMIIANLIILRLLARNRETQRELKHFEESYRLVMEGVRDGIFDYYPDTKVTYFSPSYYGLLGYPATEMPNNMDTLLQIVHPDDFQSAWGLLEHFRDIERPEHNAVFRMRHKDGSWRWILTRAVTISDEKGNIRRVVGSHSDVTLQKAHEEQLKQMNAELEGFTYIASHDLRAPLVNLKGFASEMERACDRAKGVVGRIESKMTKADREIMRESFEEDIPEALGFIRSSVEKMDKLTTAILDLSRIGRRQYRFEIADPNEIVKRTLDALAYEINNKGVEVKMEPLPKVQSDLVALEQIFSNLIDNAVKYLDPKRAGHITINAEKLSSEICFTVSDNGRGIAETDRSRVFDIFRRASNSTDVRGIGMGMAYVKAIVRKLGGRIWFESALDKGTNFHFTLPDKLSGENHV